MKSLSWIEYKPPGVPQDLSRLQAKDQISTPKPSTPAESLLQRAARGKENIQDRITSTEDKAPHGLLDLRPKSTQSSPAKGANHNVAHQVYSGPGHQKRPYSIIDLTSDDEDDHKPASPPRKKSLSSIDDYSDESVNFTSEPEKVKKEDLGSRSNSSALDQTKSKSKSFVPPTQPGQLNERLVQAPSDSCSNKPSKASVTGLTPSHRPLVSQEPPQSLSRRVEATPRARQYASAVIVRPTPLPAVPTSKDIEQRAQFQRNIAKVPKLTLSNDIDNTSPSVSFRFIQKSLLTEGVSRAPEEIMIGCDCRRKRGSNECKYPNECSCLKDSNGDTKIKRSQYGDTGLKKGSLMKHVLQNRWNIFECNHRCDCSDNCKNRVVQWGRKVALDIFKTRERGWGLRCLQDLQEGQFLDTYRGEIITTEEADKRKKGANEDNYLMDFDKFDEPKYVCDGMYMGGPTRFMNHSCEPNCALFTVSYNHYDSFLYELAFFAREFIPAGTELSFDYLDQDEVEGGRITDEDAAEMEREKGYAPSICRCGTESCRGYFFFSK